MNGGIGTLIWMGVLVGHLLIGLHVSILLLLALRPALMRMTPQLSLRIFGLALWIPAVSVTVAFGVNLRGALGHVLNEGAGFANLHCPELAQHCDLFLPFSEPESWVYVGLVFVILGAVTMRLWPVLAQRRHSSVSPATLESGARERLATVIGKLKEDPAVRLPRVAILADDTPRAFVQGIFRQTILLSPRLISSLSQEQLAGLLLHEGAHGRRFDNLQALLLEVVRRICLFPGTFHRLVGLWRLDREMHCDDVAVSRAHAPLELASALVQASRMTLAESVVRRPSHVASSTVDAVVLEARIQNLIRHAAHPPEGCPSSSSSGAGLLGTRFAAISTCALLVATVSLISHPEVLLRMHCWVESAVHGFMGVFVEPL